MACTVVVPGVLLLGGKEAALDTAALRAAGVRRVITLTAEPLAVPVTEHGCSDAEVPAYTHTPSGGGSTHAEAVERLKRACDALDAALGEVRAAGGGATLVHCSRGPRHGGVSGVVGAAHLLLSGRCESIGTALAQCDAQPRGTSLSALCDLSFQRTSRPIDAALLGEGLPSTHWEVAVADGRGLVQAGAALADGAGGDGLGEPIGASVAICSGAAMLVRALCADPQLVHVSNFVSAAEASHLISLAASRLEPSAIAREAQRWPQAAADGAEEDGAPSEGADPPPQLDDERSWRTSLSCSIGGGARNGEEAEAEAAAEAAEAAEEEDVVVRRLIERAAYLSGLSEHHAEDLQVVKYAPGTQYRPHCDYFSPAQDAGYARRVRVGGNRLLSVFCCLRPADEGGETHFPRLGVCARRRRRRRRWRRRRVAAAAAAAAVDAGTARRADVGAEAGALLRRDRKAPIYRL